MGVSRISSPYLPLIQGIAKRGWNDRFLARGPVALLLNSVVYYDMVVDAVLQVKQLGEVSFYLDSIPFQHLPCIVRDRIFNHRARAVGARSDIGHEHTVDFRLLIRATGICSDPEDCRIARWYTSPSCLSKSIKLGFVQHIVTAVLPRPLDI